jgi:hypothetical protein
LCALAQALLCLHQSRTLRVPAAINKNNNARKGGLYDRQQNIRLS